VPNDPVNLQRALWILRDLGLVEIRESKPVDVTELDVIKNFGGIRIVPLEAAQRRGRWTMSTSRRYRAISRSIADLSSQTPSHWRR
jgi:hypothetical protein